MLKVCFVQVAGSVRWRLGPKQEKDISTLYFSVQPGEEKAASGPNKCL